MNSPRNILLMMSGSIACAKASSLISHWVRQGHHVRVAATQSAYEFVGRATLEGLSGAPVFDDAFEPGRAMDHIGLAQWADLLVVCPATANLINKFAAGIADDAVTTLWLAAWGRGIPQFVTPAMNTQMWEYPATRTSVDKLKSWGVHVLPTAVGDLACGEQGAGRMLEPEDILRSIESILAFDRGRPCGRILVTGGGTREPIDAVRYISNHSTGRTSAELADAFAGLGFDVTWLGAHSAVKPNAPVRQTGFESFTDLQHELTRLLSEERFDLVVHAAAVSDFSVAAEGRTTGKLSSEGELSLSLLPNPKLLHGLRNQSRNVAIRVVGFKLTAGATPDEVNLAVRKQLRRGGVDWVVHNDLADIRAGRHILHLYDNDGREVLACHSVAELADALAGRLTKPLPEEISA